MITRRVLAAVIALALGGTVALAQLRGSGSGSGPGTVAGKPYAGEEARRITTLSEEDIAELKAGRGWGLAKPAELNGYPGPAHVLELTRELLLTDEQKTQIQTVFDWMKAQAEAAGKVYIDAEAALDSSFRSGSATADEIKARLAAAEKARAELRRIHLEAHLETRPLLTAPQIKRYSELRGYTAAGAGKGSGSGSGTSNSRSKMSPGKGSGSGSGSGSAAGTGSGAATAMGGGCCCSGGGCGGNGSRAAGGACGGGDGTGMSCRPARQ
jgi:Spy/CpxP family protein refolding chaperone